MRKLNFGLLATFVVTSLAVSGCAANKTSNTPRATSAGVSATASAFQPAKLGASELNRCLSDLGYYPEEVAVLQGGFASQMIASLTMTLYLKYPEKVGWIYAYSPNGPVEISLPGTGDTGKPGKLATTLAQRFGMTQTDLQTLEDLENSGVKVRLVNERPSVNDTCAAVLSVRDKDKLGAEKLRFLVDPRGAGRLKVQTDGQVMSKRAEMQEHYRAYIQF